MQHGLRGVGVGYRPQLAHALLAEPSRVDFVEVVVEACRDGRARREMTALSEVWPVVPHGVKLSLGSAEGIDRGRAREMGRLARELRAPVASEHVSFVRAGGREIGHLTELPMTREVVRVVARNVDALRRELPDIPLLLENVARAFVWPESAHEMEEAEFHVAIVEATGCDLLLDVGNLYANAVNAGRDPEELLARFPLDRVAMMHVAGGVREHGFYFDTHAHAVPEPVFGLVANVIAAVGDVPVMIERDGGFEGEAEVLSELARLRAMHTGRARAAAGGAVRGAASASAPADARLESAQATLAAELTCADTTTADVAILRARGVLERKRADDALPLLPELGARICASDALRLGNIAEVPRLATMTAVADAIRIAEAARAVPELASFAARDVALLRARFAGGPQGPRPRAMPYVGREVVGDGDSIWVWKGFGPGAPVRVTARRGGARV